MNFFRLYWFLTISIYYSIFLNDNTFLTNKITINWSSRPKRNSLASGLNGFYRSQYHDLGQDKLVGEIGCPGLKMKMKIQCFKYKHSIHPKKNFVKSTLEFLVKKVWDFSAISTLFCTIKDEFFQQSNFRMWFFSRLNFPAKE